MMTVSAYDIGKQIVSLKGKAKAQQALVKTCGEKFLLSMMDIFTRPVRVTMDTPDELTKWMCRGVLTAVRNPAYAKSRLADVNAMMMKRTGEERAYLEGWEKFLKEYAPQEPENSDRESELRELREELKGICTTRCSVRFQLRVRGELCGNFPSRYEELTARGKELLRQYLKLR